MKPASSPRLLVALALLAAAAPAATRAPASPPPGVPAASDTVDLVVAATTDVHGHLRGWDYFAARPDSAGSLAGAATVVDSLRRAHPGRVVLVDAGDNLQGTPLTYVAARVDTAGPHPVPAAMNAMGYDAAAVGNHEFNYGLALVERVRRAARFPLLAANARTPDGRRAFPAYAVVERGGVRVAIVGATTPGAMVWDRDHLRGPPRDRRRRARRAPRRRLGARRPAPTWWSPCCTRARRAVELRHGRHRPAERERRGRVAREVPRGSTSWCSATRTSRSPTRAIGGASWSAEELGGERGRGGASRSCGRPRPAAPRAGVARRGAARRAGLRGRARRGRGGARGHGRGRRRARAYVATPLGTTPVAWRADSARVADAAVTDFVLEVMRRRAGADLAATAAFSLDAGFAAGPVTVADLARLYPYENTLRAVRVTGAQLRAFLEQSARYFQTYDPAAPAGPAFDPQVPGYNFDVVAGADYTLDVSRPAGQRVTRLLVKGRPVADTDTFTLALNNYRQTGGGGFAMLAGAPVTYDRGEQIRDLLATRCGGAARSAPRTTTR
jgi:2',3'-cyclic-nucleotide 2'-phosphodiesterase/3'-nucleotidase